MPDFGWEKDTSTPSTRYVVDCQDCEFYREVEDTSKLGGTVGGHRSIRGEQHTVEWWTEAEDPADPMNEYLESLYDAEESLRAALNRAQGNENHQEMIDVVMKLQYHIAEVEADE